MAGVQVCQKNGKIISSNLHVHMHCTLFAFFLLTTNLLCISLQGPQQYVDELLDIHRKFSVLIKDTFRDDPAFISALDKVIIHNFVIFGYTKNLKRSLAKMFKNYELSTIRTTVVDG